MAKSSLRNWRSLLLLACSSLLAACAGTGQPEISLEPKIVQTGGLPVLYHANSAQIHKLFPIGTPRSAIHEKFGKPTLDSGSTTDMDIYAYGQAYNKLNLDRSGVTLTRTVTAQVTYTPAGRVKEVSPLIVQQHVASQNGVPQAPREATDDEIQQHLPVNPALVDEAIAKGFPGVAATSHTAEAPKKAEPAAKSWRPGLQIMEYQSNTGRAELRVSDFDAGSPAKARGVRVNDVIVSVNGSPTTTPAAYTKAVTAATTDKPLVLRLRRAGKLLTVTLPVTK